MLVQTFKCLSETSLEVVRILLPVSLRTIILFCLPYTHAHVLFSELIVLLLTLAQEDEVLHGQMSVEVYTQLHLGDLSGHSATKLAGLQRGEKLEAELSRRGNSLFWSSQ